MLSYEIHEVDDQGKTKAILLNIPYGKSYLSDPKHFVNQEEQKGGTCWYYAMNYLRPRYGFFFPSSNPHRHVEKVLSEYRKKLTAFEDALDYFEELDEDLKHHTLSEKKSIIECRLTNLDLNPYAQTFLKNFVTNSPEIFLTSANAYITNELINTQKKTLQSLNVDAEKALDDFLVRMKVYKNFLTSDQVARCYSSLIIVAAAESYHLQPSTWQLDQDIQSLIDTLKSNGPCYAVGFYGNFFYHNYAHLLPEKFGKRPIYAWTKDEYRTDIKVTSNIHAILIVGAEREKDKAYVYFMDPNISNKVNGTGKIFKISYERFVSSISNIYGRHNSILHRNERDDPFVLHADLNFCQQQKEFYTAYKDFLQQEKEEALCESQFTPRMSS